MDRGLSPTTPSWKGRLRRLLAAPFRFLLKDELASFRTIVREFEEVRDRRLPGLAADFSRFQGAFQQLQSEMERLRDERLPILAADFSRFQGALQQLQSEMEALRDGRLPRLEEAQGSLQAGFEALQGELLELRDRRVTQLEGTQAGLHADLVRLQGEVERLRDEALPGFREQLRGVQALGEELRDQRLPAAVARLDALLARLGEELALVRGLVDRILHREPLAVPPLEKAREEALPAAVREASLRFMEKHRGSRGEIGERAQVYVDIFRHASPVLDLGCGRGELLQVLVGAGIEAFGVDADPAAVAVCRDLGLPVEQRDALEALQRQKEGSLGGVAMVHLVEHLPTALWMQLFAESRRVLRPGGILAVESPNPESLRVATTFWLDPTHLRPVHPEAARFVAEALGFEVVELRRLRPFPAEQRLVGLAQDEGLRQALRVLDEWLSGPRDYVLIVRKPA
ncbi:MAG: methyltransferase domain-containing protein [Thermoanaerobaculaceae bacterium]